MQDTQPKSIYLKDYQAPYFVIDETHLRFDLFEDYTQVDSRLVMRRNKEQHENDNSPLVLVGQQVELLNIKVFTDYHFNHKFHINLGVSYSFETISYSYTENFGVSIGIPLGIYYRIWKLELGVEPTLIFFNDEGSNDGFEKGTFTTSILIIKIPLNKW